MNATVYGVITRLDANVARLHFINKDEHAVPIPEGFFLTNASNGKKVPEYHNEFMITWTTNYTLYAGPNHVFMHIDAQRGYNCYVVDK